MHKKYTRQGEETVKECGNCKTVWKDSWLEPHQNKNECPFCYNEWKEEANVKLPKIKKQNINWKEASKRKRLIKLEHNYKIADLMTFKHESTPLVHTKAIGRGGMGEVELGKAEIIKQNKQNNQELRKNNARKYHTLFEISKMNLTKE